MEITSEIIEAHVFRIEEKSIKFLNLKRSSEVIYPGVWQPVTGKIKSGEKAYETALREIKEETGIIPLKLWAAPQVNSFYSVQKDAIYMVPIFAALTDVKDIQLCSEHCEYKWVTREEANKLVAWEGQKQAMRVIEDYFLNNKVHLDLVEIKF
ncbi:MAG TPA: NUDIX domain-containing protein [Ignavibacteriaceae bacterium]|nr:NUDIX domain-containing protein [Ignavibacteriaceae bacterium]